MSYTIARYALWILLCLPVFVLGIGLFNSLINEMLSDSRARKARQEEKAKKQKRQTDEEDEYWDKFAKERR